MYSYHIHKKKIYCHFTRRTDNDQKHHNNGTFTDSTKWDTKVRKVRSSLTFISIYPVQPEDWIHLIIATLCSKMPTKTTHCRLLENQTMPPFSSHRIINKGSFKNRRWRGKWRAGPPTLKLRYRRLLMTSTETCSGRVHLTSANSRR